MSVKPLFAIAALLLTTLAHAHSYQAGKLEIDHPHARPSIGAQSNGVAYMKIENKGQSDDALLSASSPVAASVEVHNMSMEGDVMKMRAVPKLDIKAGSIIEMKAGDGFHIMLMGLKKPLKAGDKFAMTLQFQRAGKVNISVHVSDKGMEAKPAAMDDMHDMHEHEHEHDHHNH